MYKYGNPIRKQNARLSLSVGDPRAVPGLTGYWCAVESPMTMASTKVARWDDISGNGRHLSQAVDANRPSLVANDINGLPAVSFSGGSIQLTSTTPLSAVITPTSATIVAAVRFTNTGNPNIFGDSSNAFIIYRGGGGGDPFRCYNDDGAPDTAYTPIDITRPHIVSGMHSNGYLTAFVDSMSGILAASGNTATLTGTIQIPHTAGHVINVGCVAIFNRALAEGERLSIERFFRNKFKTG